MLIVSFDCVMVSMLAFVVESHGLDSCQVKPKILELVFATCLFSSEHLGVRSKDDHRDTV